MNTLEKIFNKSVIDFDTYFHLLRHFQKIDKDFSTKFVSQTQYNLSDVEHQMNKPGSKFQYSFVKNPEELIIKLATKINYKSYYVSNEGSKTKIAIEFDHEAYLKGIGLDGIIAIRKLIDDEKAEIKKIEKVGYLIKEISIPRKTTWKLNIILIEKDDNYLVVDFSPGIYVPPIPNEEIHHEEQFLKYVKFWEEHVMIV